jgi:chemotaxis protein CheZ
MVAKRTKNDETGDSDDLQALFDSIAEGGAAPEPAPAPVVAPPPPPPPPPPVAAAPAPTPVPTPAPAPAVAARPAPAPSTSSTDDNDELQALFDSEASKFAAPAAAHAPAHEGAGEGEGNVKVFNRIGQMTRKLHDMLIELGLDSALQEVAETIPDARQRLTYVAQMTEQAASRVLNATDVAKPLVDRIETEAAALRVGWDKVFANQLPVEEFPALAGETRAFLDTAVSGGQAVDAQLLEIMMAQDFQDLTGQVIKKVVEMAQSLEDQMLQILIEVAPEDIRTEQADNLLNGPVINGEGRDDVVTSQGQVDDLLASLGF